MAPRISVKEGEKRVVEFLDWDDAFEATQDRRCRLTVLHADVFRAGPGGSEFSTAHEGDPGRMFMQGVAMGLQLAKAFPEPSEE